MIKIYTCRNSDRNGFTPKTVLFFLIGLMFAAAVVSGCVENEESAGPDVYAIETHYEQGPATVELRVDRNAITVAEKLVLEIVARVDDGYTVELPEFDKASDAFQIDRVTSPPPELQGDGRILARKTYLLKPFLSGVYTIPSMDVRFSKPGPEPAASVVVRTEPVEIRVDSLLTGQTNPELKEILPPEALPRKPYLLIAAVAAGLLLLGVGFFGYRLYRKKTDGQDLANHRPPHEIAHDRLRDLLAEQLVEKGEIKLFYLRLSGILRRYIENRFGLKAPEQTTEEFLNAMKTADDLTPLQKQVLKRFLEHCDQVKFAGHEPVGEEIRETLNTVRQFIDETAAPENGEPEREKQKNAV